MKKTVTLIIVLLITITTFAQQGINYKALIKDDLGNVVANATNITVQFTIYEGAALTNSVYTETHINVSTDANGIVVLNIGNGTTTDVFTDITWGNDEHWLNVQIDIGAGLVDVSTSQFMAVPYALNAVNAATKIDDLSDGKTDASGTSLFLGTTAGSNNNASFNTGVGYNTLFSNTIGSDNTAIGYTALDSNVSGSDNNAFGFSALGNNISGNDNVAIGKNTLKDMTSGSDNAAVGNNSLFRLVTGTNNTALGTNALSSLQEGSGNVAIGHRAGSNLQNSSNKLFIDNKLTNQPLIYGEFDNDLIRIYGSFEVNNGFPRFQILENGTITAPNLTNSLINTAGNKALTTKEYVDSKTPIAYGIIESTGNVLSGTGNFTAFLSGNVFIVDVNGTESLSYGNTVCLITPISTAARTTTTIITDGNGDGDADLNVRVFNASGTQVTTTFQFVIYKL